MYSGKSFVWPKFMALQPSICLELNKNARRAFALSYIAGDAPILPDAAEGAPTPQGEGAPLG
jgi:hypothetical protein